MPEKIHGDEIMQHDPNGTPLPVVCSVKDLDGHPIKSVRVEIWETDSTGSYDVQHEDYSIPDGRCFMTSDHEGLFWFKGIIPVSYPIPHDGTVGKMLKMLGRHPWRPAHMHFILTLAGYDRLVTYVFFMSLSFTLSSLP
jgi:protocatechuate 3,4-dioxygenase beta subunit